MKRPEIRYKFGAKIRKLRKKHGLTQEDLAGRAEVSTKHIQRLEGKKPSPIRIDTIEKLAVAFKIPAWKLLRFRD